MAILALAVVAVALMTWLQVRHVRRVGRERRATVADVEALLADAVTTQDGIGYPTVTGRYAGYDAKVEFIVDTLTMRQLPRLWLTVTLKRRMEVDEPVDILLRPLSTDMVSPGQRFPYEHPAPAAWPDHIRIATPQPTRLPPLDDVDALTSLLHDPSTKSVVIAPRGVRVVHELARGEVSSHRVIRRPNFHVALEAARVRALLDIAMDVADGVDRLTARVGATA